MVRGADAPGMADRRGWLAMAKGVMSSSSRQLSNGKEIETWLGRLSRLIARNPKQM